MTNVLNSVEFANRKSVAKNKNNQKVKIKTHLHLQEKHFTEIPKINPSYTISVIYLYDNEITRIDNLDVVPHLTYLYLQNNKISKIENLNNLPNLKKLYLGHNAISVLEGLENLNKLEELHLEKQYLPDGICMCIDPRSVQAISETLKVLNISHNNLTSIKYLSHLSHLIILDVSYNDLQDLKEVCNVISNWYFLSEANFTGNPVSKRHRYKETIVASVVCLKVLDEKEISDNTRTFIKKFEEEKLSHGMRKPINLSDHVPGLPNNYPHTLQKAVSCSLIKGCKTIETDLSTFDEKDAVHIAWNKLPSRPNKPRLAKLTIPNQRRIIPKINNPHLTLL